MPSLFNMADAKDTSSDAPVVITQMTAEAPKPRSIKKYVIIAVSAILAVAIILAAILVGMYMFTGAQKELLKYTMDVDKDTKEEMTTDPNENVIQYHVQNVNYEMWVVDDYNRDIEMMKIQTKTDTNCYVVPMNRTTASDPSKIKTPSKILIKENFTDSLIYDVATTPISDSSFLTKKAKDLCKGISVYWMYPKCSGKPDAVQRQKRGYYYRCYYYYYYCYTSLYGYYSYNYSCYRYLCSYYYY